MPRLKRNPAPCARAGHHSTTEPQRVWADPLTVGFQMESLCPASRGSMAAFHQCQHQQWQVVRHHTIADSEGPDPAHSSPGRQVWPSSCSKKPGKQAQR